MMVLWNVEWSVNTRGTGEPMMIMGIFPSGASIQGGYKTDGQWDIRICERLEREMEEVQDEGFGSEPCVCVP